MIYLSILFSSILFAAPVDSALKEALQKRIYEDRYWALLLHYSGGESEIEDDSFFISENGRVSKKDELVASACYALARLKDYPAVVLQERKSSGRAEHSTLLAVCAGVCIYLFIGDKRKRGARQSSALKIFRYIF